MLQQAKNIDNNRAKGILLLSDQTVQNWEQLHGTDMGTKMVGSVIFSQIMQSVDHNIYARHSTIHDICNDYDDDMDVFPSVAEP